MQTWVQVNFQVPSWQQQNPVDMCYALFIGLSGFRVVFCFRKYTSSFFVFPALLMWPCATERTYMSISKYSNYSKYSQNACACGYLCVSVGGGGGGCT